MCVVHCLFSMHDLCPAKLVVLICNPVICEALFTFYLQDKTITYWRKFVAEYYSPRAKKRWCLSLYDNVGNHALGVLPQAAMVSFLCCVC